MEFTWHFSNEKNGDLFELGVTECEECSRYAVGLFSTTDDSGLFAYCYRHMTDSVGALAADVLLGKLDPEELSDLQLMLVDEVGECPACGEGLDTGAGSGQRDLECSDFCMGPSEPEVEGGPWFEGCNCGGDDEDAHCGWSGSYPLELYRDKLMRKHVAYGNELQKVMGKIVEGVEGLS